MNNVIINAPQLNSNDDELLVLDIIKKMKKLKKEIKFFIRICKTSVEIEVD